MKKIITLTIIGLLAGIVFSSCGSKMSLTKRHYNKGYHFAHSNGKGALQKAKPEQKLAHNKPSEVLSPLATYSVQPIVKENNFKNPVISNERIVASNEKKGVTTRSLNPEKHVLNFKALTIEKPKTQFKHSLLEVNKAHNNSDGGGLSLFWIIILVLVILWALGFSLGSMGGLIHVLLVIALILFILWLLHIV
jgi:hypothetical protein